MIMEELGDVDKAIEFAKEQDDVELWEDLISYSIDKPRTFPLFSPFNELKNLTRTHWKSLWINVDPRTVTPSV